MILTWIFGSVVIGLLGLISYFLWRITQNTYCIFGVLIDIYEGLDAMFSEPETEKSDVEKAVDDILNPPDKKKKKKDDEND